MKETMTMRFFSPIWKCEEIEAKLEQLEKDGWRLDKISGFRKFRFVRSQSKDVKYFFTCSFAKTRGMGLTKQTLVSKFKANQISGGFIELLKDTSVYRITRPEDLLVQKFHRHIHLRYLVLQYILIGLIFATIATAGITLSCIFDNNPLFEIRHLFLSIVGFLGLIVALRNLFGLVYLRRRYTEYFQSKQNTNSKK